MATSATPLAVARAAFAGMIDYAGLFPPAQLEMQAALAEYAAARNSSDSWMLARFIVPESRTASVILNLSNGAPSGGEGMPLSIIVDAGTDPRAWFGNVQAALTRIVELRKSSIVHIGALEVPLPPLLSLRETYDAAIGQYAAAAAQAGLRDTPSYIEMPPSERWLVLLPGAMAALQRHRLGAKLRCGGVNADAVPSLLDVATFLVQTRDEGVGFKATAGLHHPIRGYNEQDGFVMHGFLNLLVAASLARSDVSLEELITALEDEDAEHFKFDSDALIWNDRRLSAELVKETRARSFATYGSCSFDEPVADLRALGMIV